MHYCSISFRYIYLKELMGKLKLAICTISTSVIMSILTLHRIVCIFMEKFNMGTKIQNIFPIKEDIMQLNKHCHILTFKRGLTNTGMSIFCLLINSLYLSIIFFCGFQ